VPSAASALNRASSLPFPLVFRTFPLSASDRSADQHRRHHERPVFATAVTLATSLPASVLLALSGGVAALMLLVYIGIALPAVWSAKPARRKAAAIVLGQILDAWTDANRH
jgi:hypothetical protein